MCPTHTHYLARAARLLCVGVMALVATSGCGLKVPPGHAKLNLHRIKNGNTNTLEVYVNNAVVASLDGDTFKKEIAFETKAEGDNIIEIRVVGTKYTSGPKPLFATPGAEINVQFAFNFKSPLFGPDEWSFDLDISTMKYGSEVTRIETVALDGSEDRKVVTKDTVTGVRGSRYCQTHKRTLQRAVSVTNVDTLETTLGATVKTRLVDISTGIRRELQQKDSVFSMETEEICKEMSFTFDESGTAELEWVDHVRHGTAKYKVNDKVHTIKFDIVYATELTLRHLPSTK